MIEVWLIESTVPVMHAIMPPCYRELIVNTTQIFFDKFAHIKNWSNYRIGSVIEIWAITRNSRFESSICTASNSANWKWKSAETATRRHQRGCFSGLLGTFGLPHQDKTAVAGWMLSEMLSEVPEHVPKEETAKSWMAFARPQMCLQGNPFRGSF